jgi:glycosyltransferase involved in cell wall biosynthesis
MARLAQVIVREGAWALAVRQISQASGRLVERTRIWRGAGRPWRPDGRPVFLLISHDCGGGTERHVRELGAALLQERVRPLLVRPSRAGGILWEEHDDSGRSIWCRESTDERDSIARHLILLRPAHAHVHHLMGLPEVLMDLLVEHGVPYDWTVHDYHTICPRVNLIGAGGKYCGEPDAGSCNRCLAMLGNDQGRPVEETITAWRERFGRRLGGARRVFAPSEDVGRRLARYFAGLPVRLRPHPEALPLIESLAAPPVLGETIRVAVLGTIVPVKGVLVLEACARDARRRKLPLAFHVIGSTDRNAAFARLGNVLVTGRYREKEIFELLAAQRCHLAFLPSLCPESYMYTLSAAMAARLFVVCFDHGAQAERLRAWGWGRILSTENSPESINDALLDAARSLADGPSAPPPPQSVVYPEILTSYYDFTLDELGRLRNSPSRRDKASGNRPQNTRRRDHAHLY